MKNNLLILLSLLFLNCTSWKVNLAFNHLGIYDDALTIKSYTDNKKEIAFINIKHIGTQLFYDDVKKNIDSLQSLNYMFYTEMVYSDSLDENVNITNAKNLKLMGYDNLIGIDSLKDVQDFVNTVFGGKVKLKKPLIYQPPYAYLGVNPSNNIKLDLSAEEIISLYEKLAGEEIGLSQDYKIDRKIADQVILDERNKNLIYHIENDTIKKVAIIYGSGHLKGIESYLLSNGYFQIK